MLDEFGAEGFVAAYQFQILQDNPDAKIEITGYADTATGNDKVNRELSEQRAKAVVDMLTSAGISAGRISYKAAGGDRMKVVGRTNFGHHPHGCETDDTTISDFFRAR